MIHTMAYEDSAVDWQKLEHDRHTYERMVSVVLSYLHPGAHRTDGAGGDEGKDVFFPADGGPVVFQLKSCAARMNTTRWTQVQRSLKRAAGLNPSAWWLVLPIDFTPAEERKFAEITAPFPFPCDYHGLTWLDGQMAAHPVVPRYFLQGGAARVVELLTQLQQEQAGLLGGAPDLVPRLQRLSALADEIDPHYRVAFSVDHEGHVSFSLAPRYPGAEKDRPVTVTASFSFPPTPEGHTASEDLDAALRYGTETLMRREYVTGVDIDAPAGLGAHHATGDFLIKGTDVTAPPFGMTLVVTDPDGRRIASLPMQLTRPTVGYAGIEAVAVDPSGCFRCRVRADNQQSKLHIRHELELPPRCLPAVALPLLRFLAKFGSPNSFLVEFEGTVATPPAQPITREPWVSDAYVEIVGAFERVQAYTNTFFNLPPSLSLDDSRELVKADRLIRGETLEQGWRKYGFKIKAGDFLRLGEAAGVDLFNGEPQVSYFTEPQDLTICGHAVELGIATRTLRSAVVENADELRRACAGDPEQEVEVHLRPGATDEATLKLGTPAEWSSSDAPAD